MLIASHSIGTMPYFDIWSTNVLAKTISYQTRSQNNFFFKKQYSVLQLQWHSSVASKQKASSSEKDGNSQRQNLRAQTCICYSIKIGSHKVYSCNSDETTNASADAHKTPQ